VADKLIELSNEGIDTVLTSLHGNEVSAIPL
jgi:hypothetical protein